MSPIFPPAPPTLAPTADGRTFPVRRVFCVGRNYADHAREMGSDPDREPPFFFTKWAEAIVPDDAVLAYPPATADFQYEAELVVAIHGGGRDIAPAKALDHVWGYACGLDMTRRDLQGQAKGSGRPWDTAKNFEQAAPLGLIHPAEAVGHLKGGVIRLDVNGRQKQQGDLAAMIWPVPDVVAFLSGLYRLEPGDLIFTGTPAGVGPVVAGDRITVEIKGLSALSVTIGDPAAR